MFGASFLIGMAIAIAAYVTVYYRALKYRRKVWVHSGYMLTTPLILFESPFGRIALSVCYDVRFPELYRALAPMDIILVPSAFTATTGRAHWETLLRARAIENLAWVLAPAQGGKHPNGRQTHGHSMVVDPWGKVIAERAAGPGVVLAGIDPAFQAKMRRSLPALTHRVS